MSGDWIVNPGRLWAIGVTTSVVAALAGGVVWLFATQVFDEILLVGNPSGDTSELTVGMVLIVSFLVGIVATGLLHLLLAFVPRGDLFFSLIGTLILFLSFIPIAQLDGVTTANQLWLAGMHIVVVRRATTSSPSVSPVSRKPRDS
jgi:hypothetical protein